MTTDDVHALFTWVWTHPPMMASDGVLAHLLSVPLEQLPLERCADTYAALRAPHPYLKKPGIEFEEALCALLTHHPHVRELRRGVVLPNQSGQLDFVFSLTTAPGIFHLEVAVKFYCCVDSAGTQDMRAFVGPHQGDSLQRKHDKLILKQLPAFDRDNVVALVPGQPRQSWLLVQGELAVQHPRTGGAIATPACTLTTQRIGTWTHKRDVDAWLRTLPDDTRFVQLHDHALLLRVRTRHDVHLDKDQLRAFLQNEQVPYVAVDVISGGRHWVVPDTWVPELL
jgi:hypothetical protein